MTHGTETRSVSHLHVSATTFWYVCLATLELILSDTRFWCQLEHRCYYKPEGGMHIETMTFISHWAHLQLLSSISALLSAMFVFILGARNFLSRRIQNERTGERNLALIYGNAGFWTAYHGLKRHKWLNKALRHYSHTDMSVCLTKIKSSLLSRVATSARLTVVPVLSSDKLHSSPWGPGSQC